MTSKCGWFPPTALTNMFNHLPSSIFIPIIQPFIQFLIVFGESQPIAHTNGLGIHLSIRNAAFHASHGGYQTAQFAIPGYITGWEQVLLTSQPTYSHHKADVSRCIVFFGRCTSADDMLHIERFALSTEPVVISLQGFPGSPITIGHALKLYKTLVGLFFTCTLPAVGRVTDIKWVIVSKSSIHRLFTYLISTFERFERTERTTSADDPSDTSPSCRTSAHRCHAWAPPPSG